MRLVSLFLLSMTANADVIVVDAAGGGDFDSLDAAVAAAAEGDTLLVRGGSYGNLAINGKSLDVVAAPGADVDVTNIGVSNLAEGQSVVLSGLDARLSPVFIVRDCDGAVWAQNCELLDSTSVTPYHAAEAHTSRNVVLHHSMLKGGEDQIDFDGGHGLLLFGDSEVAAWSSGFDSGVGGQWALSSDAGDGGHGVHVKAGGDFYGMGCTFLGAIGGNGPPNGVDGAGAFVAPNATARMADVVTVGAGTAPNEIGPVEHLTATARELEADPVVHAESIANWTIRGVAGDEAFLIYGQRPYNSYIPIASGVLTLDTAAATIPLGTIDANGELELAIEVPALPAGEESTTYLVQLAVRTTAGDYVLGNPVAIEAIAPTL